MNKIFKRSVPLILALTIAAGACSADDGNDVATQDTKGGAGDTAAQCKPAQGVTDTSVKFGISTPLSGPSATIGKEGLAAQEAWIAGINDAGGIAGRKIELVSQDDGFDPQKAVTNAQYLIDQAKVFAIWGDVGTAMSVAVLPVTKQSDTPFLFPYALARSITEPVSPNAFSIATTVFVQNQVLSQYMSENEPFKGKKLGLLVIASSDGQETVDGFKAGPSAGNVVSSQTYERNVTTFKSQLLAFKSAGAQVIYTGVADAQFAKILSEAEELGMLKDHIFFGSTGSVTANAFTLAKDQIEGAYGLVFASQDASGSEPGAKALSDALAKYKPGEKAGTFSVHGWVSAEILGAALKKAGKCLNAETLQKSLESLSNFDTGGLTGPIAFSPTQHLGNQSIKVVQAKNGKWTAVTDWITKK